MKKLALVIVIASISFTGCITSIKKSSKTTKSVYITSVKQESSINDLNESVLDGFYNNDTTGIKNIYLLK
jgi:hypothetical protein